ncbi:MAG: 6-phosphogluconolactonase [Deltaproteobacteria bacterium]|nr:6-phosphogluconolactonase [Deltaproteobacteria bacterium]
MTEIIIHKKSEELARAGAGMILTWAKEAVAEKGFFLSAISGGSTPRPLHRLFKEEPYLSEMPWSAFHLFWVDERCVRAEDPDSNYGTAKKDFLDRIPIPKHQIHPMRGDVRPDKGTEQYQKELETFFHSRGKIDPVFDLILLGIGTDGHTASLFPGHGALNNTKKWVVAVKGGRPNVFRITLTLPILNAAQHVIILASGKEKAQIVEKIFHDKGAILPAQRIQPVHGDLIWLMDEEAASALMNDTPLQIDE